MVSSAWPSERSGLWSGGREGDDVHVAGRPLDRERQSGDPPAVGGPFEPVVVTAADCPHGAAGGVGEHVRALHVGRAGCPVAVEVDHVTGDQVVECIEAAQRLAVSLDYLRGTEGLWLAAEE